MPAVQSRLSFEALRSRDSATFTGSYQTLGPPMEHIIRMFKITNNSSSDITVSYDGGVTDHEYIPADSFFLLDITSNKVWDCQFALSAKTQVSIKGSSGTGLVYLSTYYAS